MKKLIGCFAVGMALCLAGCSRNIKDIKVTEENKTTLLTEIKDSKQLTVEEVGLLQSFLLRNALAQAFSPENFQKAMSGEKPKEVDVLPVGKTIGEMIDEERQWQADEGKRQADAKAKAEAEKKRKEALLAALEKKREELRSAVDVMVIEKGFAERDWDAGRFDSVFTFTFAYTNKTKKAVKGIKGQILYNDQFGDLIQKSSLKEDVVLKPSKTVTVPKTLPYNQFMDEDKTLRSTPLDKITVVWVPEVILFSDGTQMKAEEEA